MQLRRFILSLILTVAMAVSAGGAATASANAGCGGMTPLGMTPLSIASKSAPCMPKAPECLDMSGCVLAAARLAEPQELKPIGFWSVGVFFATSPLTPSSTDIRPDHSPPKNIA